MQQPQEVPPNRVSALFTNKTILITGGTGFLGQLLIEKLLRTCPTLKKIYVIVRPKGGKSFEERLTEMLNGAIFDVVRQRGGEIFDKVEAISGDIGEADLALCESDRRKLWEETEIIYHLAAGTRFDGSLKFMVLLNLRGTKLVLDLAKECKKLMAFCYISTAYCHENQDVLYDNTVYAPSADPQRILQVTNCLDEDVLDRIAEHLRGTSGNNYTFTKALGEALVYEQMDKLPAIIQRPTCVGPTWREPIPGWADNLGLVVSAGTGVLRTLFAKTQIVDCCPADIVINMLICSTYDFLTYGRRRVYNLTNFQKSKIRDVVDVGMDITRTKIPPKKNFWYPNITLTRYRPLHYIYFFMFQLLPALLLDAVLILIRIKPFSLEIQKKIWRRCQVFEFYTNKEWDFRNDNIIFIKSLLNSTEKGVFKIDSEGFDFRRYLIDCVESCRVYILKGSDKNKGSDLRKIKILRYVNMLSNSVFLAGFVYLILKWLGVGIVMGN